jgi:hypothetical protein
MILEDKLIFFPKKKMDFEKKNTFAAQIFKT